MPQCGQFTYGVVMVGRTDFEREGFAVVREVVTSEEVGSFRDVFGSLIPDASQYCEITGASRAVPPLASIACDPRFGALASKVLGAPRIQLLQDSLLFKPSREGPPVEWHQDHTYVGFLVPARVLAIRIALVDEDEANCMRVVPGSHTWGPIGANRALAATSVESLLDELAPDQRARVADARPLVLRAGDVSIHHCLTLHGSNANTSERPRKTIILRMFDAACTLDRARLPPGAEAYFPTDAKGHLEASAFPIV